MAFQFMPGATAVGTSTSPAAVKAAAAAAPIPTGSRQSGRDTPSPPAGGGSQPRPYQWIAKAVVSRSPPPPQFDAFDEPRGEWYYAGT